MMASRDDLSVWASTLDVDAVTSTPQRNEITPELWVYGWLRGIPVSAQKINQLFHLITDVLKNDTYSKTLNLSDVVDKSAARTNLDLLQKSANFSDVPDKPLARTNLGIDTAFDTFFDKIYPIGTLYENKTNSANPSTYFGRGTWVAEGAGRVVVGAGSGTDTNGTVQAFTAGTTGGEYTHEQTLAELVPHTHTVTNVVLAGRDVNVTDVAVIDGTTQTGSTGSGDPFNIVQPYTVAYRWVRTA